MNCLMRIDDRRLLAALSIAAACVIAAGAEPITSVPNPRTRDGTWVTDLPRALRPESVAWLNSTISDFERTTGGEMAVVVIRSLDGMSIEEYAVKLFALWGIGKKDKDNGLLFLWSTGDRRVRVEVGYGLEGLLPDGKVGAILDGYVIPHFKAGEFDTGVISGVATLLQVARNESMELPSASSESYADDASSSSLTWRGWIAWLGSIPAALGSLVGFRKWRRYRRRRCPQCAATMVRLNEAEDDALLNEGQQAEERVGSVDYDGWKCPSCSHQFTLRYPKWLSSYAKCPQCENRTKSANETVTVAATTSSSGSARVVETCAFCNFRREYTKTLPRLQSSSSSSRSSGGSSSFGGGRSGGGGASRGY
jgi:uncharacterized protein